MRKQLLTAAAVLSLTIGAAACGSSDGGTDDSPTVTTLDSGGSTVTTVGSGTSGTTMMDGASTTS